MSALNAADEIGCWSPPVLAPTPWFDRRALASALLCVEAIAMPRPQRLSLVRHLLKISAEALRESLRVQSL